MEPDRYGLGSMSLLPNHEPWVHRPSILFGSQDERPDSSGIIQVLATWPPDIIDVGNCFGIAPPVRQGETWAVHTILRHMTRRLVRNRTFEGVVQTILDDVIALLGAEYGNIQLPIGNELAIAAQRGLSADFLKTFWRVKKNDGSACGRALRLGIPVIIADIEKDDDFAVFRRDAMNAGFRAVQSTPMVTKDGTLLGIVSTHFANVHEPTPIEMNTLKVYGAIAAEFGYMILDESYASLTAKAEKMSAELFARTLAREASEKSIEAP